MTDGFDQSVRLRDVLDRIWPPGGEPGATDDLFLRDVRERLERDFADGKLTMRASEDGRRVPGMEHIKGIYRGDEFFPDGQPQAAKLTGRLPHSTNAEEVILLGHITRKGVQVVEIEVERVFVQEQMV